MKFLKYAIWASLCATVICHAEKERGGGDAVVRYTDESRKEIVSVELFDYWEQKRTSLIKGNMHFGAGSLDEKIDVLMDRLAKVDAIRAFLYRKRSHEIAANIPKYLTSDFSLSDVGSNIGLSRPNPPEYQERFAVQTNLSYQIEFQFRRDLFESPHTSDDTRVGLILHEVILQEALAAQRFVTAEKKLDDLSLYSKVHFVNYLIALQELPDYADAYRRVIRDLSLMNLFPGAQDLTIDVVDEKVQGKFKILAFAESELEVEAGRSGYTRFIHWEADEKLVKSIAKNKKMQLPSSMLFNGFCHGENSCVLAIRDSFERVGFRNLRYLLAVQDVRGNLLDVPLNKTFETGKSPRFIRNIIFSDALWKTTAINVNLSSPNAEEIAQLIKNAYGVYDSNGKLLYYIGSAYLENGSVLDWGALWRVRIYNSQSWKLDKHLSRELTRFAKRYQLDPDRTISESICRKAECEANLGQSSFPAYAKDFFLSYQLYVYKISPTGSVLEQRALIDLPDGAEGARGIAKTFDKLFK